MPINFSYLRDSIPLTSGIYFFRDTAGNILYIGKAANLRNRLSSYFIRGAALDAAKRHMLEEAERITWKETVTEIEALLLEASLIKKHLPPYNIALRDDKQYLFVGFTKEQFSRIVFTHQPIAFAQGCSEERLPPTSLSLGEAGRLRTRREGGAGKAKKKPEYKKVEFLGPFMESGAIKRLLRSLRKTFPYCTCKNFHERHCQQAELGLCMGICCLKSYEAESYKGHVNRYQKNLRFIKNILRGRQQQLLARLEIDMRLASKQQNFELATHFRDQSYVLERIFAHKSILKTDYAAENQKGLHELRMLLGLQKTPERIEGYDISNIQGSFAVGSMVVFTDGIADKQAYRKFCIKSVYGANDPAMIHEIISRRLKHPEWPLPEIILIDGGHTQLNAALQVLSKINLPLSHLAPAGSSTVASSPSICAPVVISIAKREEELYTTERNEPFTLKEMPRALLHLIQQIRNESHRFAISYYRKRHRMQTKKSTHA